MSLVTAGSARSAGVTSSEQVQATILVNNGNIQIGPKVKVSAKLYSIWLMTIKNSLAYCISWCNVKSVSMHLQQKSWNKFLTEETLKKLLLKYFSQKMRQDLVAYIQKMLMLLCLDIFQFFLKVSMWFEQLQSVQQNRKRGA